MVRVISKTPVESSTRYVLEMAFARVAQRKHLAYSSNDSGSGEPYSPQDADDDNLAMLFRLPRHRHKALVPRLAIRGVIDCERMAEILEPIVETAARELRGRALVDLANQEFTVPDGDDEHWQKLERAGMRLIEAAIARRR